MYALVRKLFNVVQNEYKAKLGINGICLPMLMNNEVPYFNDCLISELQTIRKQCYFFSLVDEEVNALTICNTLANKSFVAETKMVVLSFSRKELLQKVVVRKEGKRQVKQTNLEILRNFIKHSTGTKMDCFLLLKPIADKANYEKIKELVSVLHPIPLEFNRPDKRSCRKFIEDYCKSMGYKIDKNAVHAVLSMLNQGDFYAYTQELNKVMVLLPSQRPIDPHTVSQTLTKAVDVQYSEFFLAIAKGETPKAIMILENLRKSKNAIQILTLLGLSCRYIHYCLIYGENVGDYIQKSPYFVKTYLELSSYFKRKDVRSMMSMIIDLEFQMKAGFLQSNLDNAFNALSILVTSISERMFPNV